MILVQCIEDFSMALQRYQNRLCTGNASRARQAVRQRDLRGRRNGARVDFLLGGDFVWVGICVVCWWLLLGKSLDGLDARNSRVDEIVQVVGGENGRHVPQPLLGHMCEGKKDGDQESSEREIYQKG